MITPDQFEALLPLAAAWAEKHERLILDVGVPLSTQQMRDALSIPVAQPERVRLLRVERIPIPEQPALLAVAQAIGLTAPAGLALRYGIYVLAERWGDRELISHELVHTAQYERFGNVQGFLRQYLHERLTDGYSASSLEQDAVRIAARICHG